MAEGRLALEWMQLLVRDGLVEADALTALDGLADCKDAPSANALLALIEDLLATGEEARAERDRRQP